jgi:hypothetical protein
MSCGAGGIIFPAAQLFPFDTVASPVFAAKALEPLNPRAARATSERIWTQAYVKHLRPEKAAELAAREYDATHPAIWVKRRR